METIEQLAREATCLQPADRLKLVEAILFSLDKPHPEIEQSWVREAEARLEAYRRGEIEAADWDEIRKRYGL
jgi:putative addiction module component (TIGR02574 family)